MKRSIDIAFTRESSKASIETIIQEVDRNERSTAEYSLRMAGLWNEYLLDGERAERLPPAGCISALKQLQCRIRENGVQPRQDLKVLCAAYGLQPTVYAASAMYQLLSFAEKKTEKDKTAETKDEAGHQREILETLENEIQRQEIREKLAQHMLEIKGHWGIQEPTRPTLETLLRYRVANTREFKDLLETLERIRRLRQSAG